MVLLVNPQVGYYDPVTGILLGKNGIDKKSIKFSKSSYSGNIIVFSAADQIKIDRFPVGSSWIIGQNLQLRHPCHLWALHGIITQSPKQTTCVYAFGTTHLIGVLKKTWLFNII